jgi:hypothetical protein
MPSTDGDAAGETLPVPPSRLLEDLSSEPLVAGATRVEHEGAPRPTLGGIPLLAKLGQGGMGTVYYGVHPRLGAEVAVKVLPFHLAARDADHVRRFVREAQIAARVKSPHLVAVNDVNEECGIHYLVMEYVNGKSAEGYLAEWRAKGQPGLPEAEALEICLAAARGLAAAHAEGIIHRDLKPANILIPKDREGGLDLAAAKLADLGLARSDEPSEALTATCQALGTPGYMAPEQIEDAKHARKPADVFSLGATLYMLLTGHTPFRGQTFMKVVHATLDEPHTPVWQLRSDVSASTVRLIDCCLAKAPAARYPDGPALVAALESCLAAVRSPSVPRPAPAAEAPARAALPVSRAGPTPRRATPKTAAAGRGLLDRVLAVLGAVAAGLLLAAAVWHFGFSRPESQENREDESQAWARAEQAVAEAGPDLALARGAYERYLSQQPEGFHADEARRKQTALKRTEEAGQALPPAISVACEALKRGEWQQVLETLEPPLRDLGTQPHSHRSTAESLVKQARQQMQKQRDFASRLAEGHGRLRDSAFEQARASFEAALALWPDAPPAERRKAHDGLRAANDALFAEREPPKGEPGKARPPPPKGEPFPAPFPPEAKVADLAPTGPPAPNYVAILEESFDHAGEWRFDVPGDTLWRGGRLHLRVGRRTTNLGLRPLKATFQKGRLSLKLAVHTATRDCSFPVGMLSSRDGGEEDRPQGLWLEYAYVGAKTPSAKFILTCGARSTTRTWSALKIRDDAERGAVCEAGFVELQPNVEYHAVLDVLDDGVRLAAYLAGVRVGGFQAKLPQPRRDYGTLTEAFIGRCRDGDPATMEISLGELTIWTAP